jgi:hypothetical protein
MRIDNKWRPPYAVLLKIARAVTWEDLLALWRDFRDANKELRRLAGKRTPDGASGLQAIVPAPELDDALIELRRTIAGNPVFDDPRASDMRERFLDMITDIEVWDANRS